MFLSQVPRLICLSAILFTAVAHAQLAPEIGYLHPSGGQAGTAVDVTLGGYDWTPDMQLFPHDPRIKIELLGPPSKVLVPEPPYWFGAKARGPAWPLPREFRARLTLPADVTPGVVKWQVANANGASPAGSFFVSNLPQVVEDGSRSGVQLLPPLPVSVAGQIRRIEEVDRYEFQVAKAGLVNLEVVARRIDSPLHAIVRVQAHGASAPVVDVADTEGRDATATFFAEANTKYVLSIHDLDFAGDRSYVYQLLLTTEPRVQATYPVAGRRGETRSVEFVGIGLATGANKVEAVVRDVAFPATAGPFAYRLETPNGPSRPVVLLATELAELVAPAGTSQMPLPELPCGVTAAIATRFGAGQFVANFKKGEKWKLSAVAKSIDSPLDLDLRVVSPEGKELATNDDNVGSTDPVIAFTVPADGGYQIVVGDHSGKSGSRAANFRLIVEPQREDFAVTLPTQLNVPLGGKTNLAVKVVRSGDFQGPIGLTLEGLPVGIAAPAELTIAEKKNDLPVELTSAADSAVTAALCTVVAHAKLNGEQVDRPLGKILVATVMKPPFQITPEGLDDVRKVQRGSTFLAPLLIERQNDFTGEITLEMTSKQQRHRQGLASDEFVVPSDAKRVEYPIFVPEWMETTKTSRMILNGFVKLPDPKGNVRTLVTRMQLRIGILPEGALMKLAHTAGEPTAAPGTELRIPLTLSRAAALREPVQISLAPTESQRELISAATLTLSPGDTDPTLVVRFADDPRLLGEQSLTVRAAVQKDGRWPVVSETTVLVVVRPR